MDLTIISTYRCNSKCQMCYVWQNPTNPKEEVSLNTLSKLPEGFDNLNVSGGEPTLRTDLHELIDIVYKKAKITEISSNGLHAEKLIPIIKKYPDIKVRFSLEGRDNTNNTIRGEKDGFNKKLNGIKKLMEAGGTDLGFALVIQDENVFDLMWIYELSQSMDLQLATSTLHNGFQFHKNDNYFYNRISVAKEVEKLISAMLKTNNIKNWFRAYLNLGLIEKILGHDRLISCTAGSDFLFIDPWSDVWACNVRTDLPFGNLEKQSWEEILSSSEAQESLKEVSQCSQNCWMVTTARTAMRLKTIPSLPKLQPFCWVLKNKLKIILGKDIEFDQYINYSNVKKNPIIKRESFLNKSFKAKLLSKSDIHYKLKEFHNK